jgi:mono/diheme cytochrome c family protein
VQRDGKKFSVAFLATVAVGAVVLGVAVAFLAGFFLGHFTGHDKTTTVSVVTAESEGGGEGETGEGASGEEEVTSTAEEEAEPRTEEEAAQGEGASSGKEGSSQGQGEEATTGDPAAGATVFATNCSICHGSDGHGGAGGPDLRTMPKAKTEAGAIEQVTNGGGGMPAFGGALSEEEIDDVAAYVVQEVVGSG